MVERIGKYTAKLLEILDDRKLTQAHFHIIAHPVPGDRRDSQQELNKLRNRGLIDIETSVSGEYLYSLSRKGKHTLNYYKK